MVKVKVSKKRNRSGDKFWVTISDKIDDQKVRKLYGFLSKQRIKVYYPIDIKQSLNHCLDCQENNVGGKGTDQV